MNNTIQNNTTRQPLTIMYRLHGLSMEVHFNNTPSAEIRESIKKLGFQWIPRTKCWHNKITTESLRYIKNLYTQNPIVPQNEWYDWIEPVNSQQKGA